jgi:cytochrome c biogenesis protein CcmG, thiol:disulfide interchange protein DsbE
VIPSGSRTRSPVLRAVILVLLGALALGCSAPAAQPYVFRADSSPVKVDTPALRAAKAAAGIPNCPKTRAGSASGGDVLPAVTLPCLGGGRPVSLTGLTGTPTIVNFWSQSCAPCRKESPILQRFHEAAGHRVRVLGVDWYDSQPGLAIAFARHLGLTYPQLADPDGATRAPLHIVGVPLSVFVDASGAVAGSKIGAITSISELQSIVRHDLGVEVDVAGAA